MQHAHGQGNTDHARTPVKAAFVLEVFVEELPRIKEAMSEAGARILYQRIAGLRERLWIVERSRLHESEGSR